MVPRSVPEGASKGLFLGFGLGMSGLHKGELAPTATSVRCYVSTPRTLLPPSRRQIMPVTAWRCGLAQERQRVVVGDMQLFFWPGLWSHACTLSRRRAGAASRRALRTLGGVKRSEGGTGATHTCLQGSRRSQTWPLLRASVRELLNSDGVRWGARGGARRHSVC